MRATCGIEQQLQAEAEVIAAARKRSELAEQAKQAIDLLDLLKGKTAGNLTAEESSMLENVLYDLRMRYLDTVRRA